MDKIEIDVRELPARFAELVAKAAAGDEVVVTSSGQRLALLTPLVRPDRERLFGFARGSVEWIAPDFDAPLPDEFWHGGTP
ncbi:MAG: type II toxin-antitoxin system prevent-host-death family antitoxin [Gemmataceae bacterium]